MNFKCKYMEILSEKDIIIFYDEGLRYLYHSPSGLIFNISGNMFDSWVEDYSNHFIGNNHEQSDVNNLLIESIKHYQTVIEDTDSGTYKPSCLILNVSGKCNLICPYCFSQTETGFRFHSMDLKTSVDAIRYMIRCNPDASSYTIGFFGGEPLIEYKIIENIISTVTRLYPDKQFNYTITTNGTIVNRDIIRLIKQNDISLLISLDGPEPIVNKNRPYKSNSPVNTFERIMRTSRILSEANIKYSYRATIVADTGNLLSTVTFFETLCVPYYLVFCFDSTNESAKKYAQWDDSRLNNISRQIDECYNYYYKKIEAAERIWGYYFLDKLLYYSLQRRSCIPCGAGKSLISVSDTGKIFSCMNFAPIPYTEIGNIYTGLYKDKHTTFQSKKFIETKECIDCPIRYICAGGCLAERYSALKSVREPDGTTCSLNKLIVKKDLAAYQHIKNNFPDYIDKLISKYVSTKNIFK